MKAAHVKMKSARAKTKAARIVVVGSSNTDMVIRLTHLPAPGETILGGEFMMAQGGKGATPAVGAARAGGAVSFVCRVGDDLFGRQALDHLIADGIDVRRVSRDKNTASGVALIFVAKNGENSIAVAGGANGRLSPRDLHEARDTLGQAKTLVLQLETPLETVTAAARMGAAKGATVILNPAPARALPASLLKNISILTPNETEAEILTGIKVTGIRGARTAAEELRRRGVQTVVMTLGAQGAFVANDEMSRLIPGFSVKAVDTTAAGDVFNGALAVALAEGQTLLEAVRFANAAAAISVTRRGAQSSAPTRRQIDRFLGSHSRRALVKK